MIHADGHGAFGLTGIDGKNTTPDCFRHIGAGIDGYNEQGRSPGAHVDVKQHGCAIVNEGSLYHHGGAAEDLYIGIEQSLEEAHHCPVHRILLAVGGDCLHNAHRKADHTADGCGDHCDHHGFPRTRKEHGAVFIQNICHPAEKVIRLRECHRISLLI